MTLELPDLRGGTWTWRGSLEGVEVCFTGQGPGGERDEVLRRVEGPESESPPVAWLKQIHSDAAVAANVGLCGEGDGLFTARQGLALAVATADCVPVLVATGSGKLAAIHAGWRGLANGVIAATLRAMDADGDLRAWIGPAIGPCCYEVGDEVAEAVVAASDPTVAALGPAGRPHLDLVAAARIQLKRYRRGQSGPADRSREGLRPARPSCDGIELDGIMSDEIKGGGVEIESLPLCTRCESELLWSYRRLGKRAGRNLAFIWHR